MVRNFLRNLLILIVWGILVFSNLLDPDERWIVLFVYLLYLNIEGRFVELLDRLEKMERETYWGQKLP